MHNPHRKFLSLGNHFFERLKTADSSTACGTSTLKSPLLLGSDAPHVHPRLRKHPPRCTLDCGFKISESPALRGFVGGLRALATAALYLVLKSNGLLYPKIQLKKFGFSSKPIPTNIAKKLPSQRCSKSLFIAFFNFSHKRPTFAFTGESVYTLGPAQRIAHSGPHAETRAFRTGPLSLPSTRTARSRTSPGRVSERQTLPLLRLDPVCSRRTQRASEQRCAYARRCPAGVAAPLGCVIFLLLSKLRLVHPALRAFPRVQDEGWYHHSWCALRVAETPDGRLSKRLFCRFLRLGSLH